MTRGLITVATGNEKYYKVAANLLKSYRYFSKEPLPFAILCDKENKYTKEFDDVIILKNPDYSFRDKIHVLHYAPYDETLFVESDSIAYGDLNQYFDAFATADDFCVFGVNYPLDYDFGGGIHGWGWFDPTKLYKYGDLVHFIPRFGSTFMFMRKTPRLERVYDICLDVWKNADKYGFLPLDDQILAVAIAVEDCRCVDDGKKYGPCVYPFYLKAKWHPKPEMHKKQLTYSRPDYNETTHALLCHWGNDLTTKALYKREIHSLNMLIEGYEIRLRIGVALYNAILPFSALSTILGNVYKKMLGYIMNNRKIRKLLYPVEICIKKIRKMRK